MITVTNLDDGGAGSLRWAIDETNTDPLPNIIEFDVSGTIDPVTELPWLSDNGTVIEGSTAPGGPRSVVISNGSQAGLGISGDYCRISDVVVYDFLPSIKIVGHHNVVTGCYINVQENGVDVAEDGQAVVIEGGMHNLIGGDIETDRNVICCGYDWISVFIATGSDSNTIAGNYIGVDATGTAMVSGHTVLPLWGITLHGNANTIGGEDPRFRNIICGHGNGIDITDGDYNVILNNYIGLDATGTSAISNGVGIYLYPGSAGNQIGGPGTGNIISGNSSCGISILAPSSSNNTILGNYIGTDLSGTLAVGNGGAGICMEDAMSISVGGIGPDSANVICGNLGDGISLDHSISVDIIGNYIGVTRQGDSLGNQNAGIKLVDATTNCDIRENSIAFNHTDGIELIDESTRWITISRNLIYSNAGIGIDLNGDGVSPNDPGDTGPNGMLDYPEVDSIWIHPFISFTVYGTTPAGSGTVEVYVAYEAGSTTMYPDPSGHGEAYQFVGEAPYAEKSQFQFTVPNTVPYFSTLTAISIDASGNTSEFSVNFSLVPAPLVFYVYSPVNMMITDPIGAQFGKLGDETFIQEIEPADYFEEPDVDSVMIHRPLGGTYRVEIYGTVDAQPGDTYTMGTRINGTTQVIIVTDEDVPLYGMPPDTLEYVVEEDWHYENGDANRSGGVDIDDVVFMIAYIFTGGPVPNPPGAGDANCSLELDIDDVVYMIAYIFSGGDAPCSYDE